LVWDTSVEADYMTASNWTVTLSYVDETLLGPAVNIGLYRTLSLNLQYRWER
jgi:hypothetical protein